MVFSTLFINHTIKFSKVIQIFAKVRAVFIDFGPQSLIEMLIKQHIGMIPFPYVSRFLLTFA